MNGNGIRGFVNGLAESGGGELRRRIAGNRLQLKAKYDPQARAPHLFDQCVARA